MDNLSEHDKKIIKEFTSWLCNKYEIFEPEEDGYVLYGDMKYHSADEVLTEYFDKFKDFTNKYGIDKEDYDEMER